MSNLQSRFQVAPSHLDKNRSRFDIPYRHLTTGNFGKLIPFYLQEVLPGDTFDVQTKLFARMSTPLYPVMDNAVIDYYYFFVPNRLIWDSWAEFLGENKLSAWTQEDEYIIPHAPIISLPGSLADHFGIPTYSEESVELDVNFLPFRAYWLIWNEWFRNENVQDPILVNTGNDVTIQESDLINAGPHGDHTDMLCSVCKQFDYFTSALPSPQKGDAVDIPLGNGLAPVITGRETIDPGYFGYDMVLRDASGNVNGGNLLTAVDGEGHLVSSHSTATETVDDSAMHPANLYAALEGSNISVTVNALRQAFQMQRLLELQARSGTRYTEIIKASFGVTSPDARLQRPEYLGGKRVDVQMQQVTQTSSSDSASPLGHTGAYSKTVSANKDFSQSFTEHGYVIGVMCARTMHTYQQGLHPMWSRRDRYSIYWPTFANIGEQPIYRKQLYAKGDSNDDIVFGYQEAWAEYRYKPNEVTGAFRSTVNKNLDEWHYADYYESPPVLSEGWMQETPVNVDRTLAVSSELHDQLLFDISVHLNATRVMPLYSIPGLIDHL